MPIKIKNPLSNPYRGEIVYDEPGTYKWLCPPNVTSVCAVVIGGGGGGHSDSSYSMGGSGGGLGWKNNIPVTPGIEYNVVVGKGGLKGQYTVDDSAENGGSSWFVTESTVWARFGAGGARVTSTASGKTGGTFIGDGGGNGGHIRGPGSYAGGGAGAGGYAGHGGDAANVNYGEIGRAHV